jgi:hypothetical protein
MPRCDDKPRDELQVRRGVYRDGGCNFCNRIGFAVWVLQGGRRTLEVRICAECLAELKHRTR